MADQAADTAIRIEDIPPQPTAAARMQTVASALPSVFDRYLPEVAKRVGAAGGMIGGPPFARYHRFSPDSIDIEVGFPVAGRTPDLPDLEVCEAGQVGLSELPGGRVARTIHRGSYDGLAGAYDRLHDWIHQQPGVDDGDGPWEVYLDLPDPAADPETIRTEIIWPLRTM